MKLSFFGILVFVIILSTNMNIGNYSFFTYSFDGTLIRGIIGKLLAASRLPICLLPLVLFLGIGYKLRKQIGSFLIQNLDVVLFVLASWFSIINSIDKVNAFFYTVWHNAIFFAILAYFFYIAHKSYNRFDRLYNLGFILFWSNVIVLPFLLVNLNNMIGGGILDMAFSGIPFAPYCVLSLMFATYIFLYLKKNNPTSKKGLLRFSRPLYWFFSLFLFILLLGGARRTPLVISIVLTLGFLYLYYGTNLWQRVVIIGVMMYSVFLFVISIPIIIERYGDQFYTLERFSQIEFDAGGNISEGKFSKSYMDRLLIWDSYFKLVRENPVFGTGLFNSKIHHVDRFKNWRLAGYSPHNSYISIIVEQGYIGIFFFLIVLFRSIFLMATKERTRLRYLYFLILISMLVINWNEYNSLGGQVFFWTSFLIILYPRVYLVKQRELAFT